MNNDDICEKTGMNWELWRQDEHGNRFLVGRYESKSAAEAKLAELCRMLHKQIYWISSADS